jgi:ribosomal protein S18 acetylase RimI-like enzyme
MLIRKGTINEMQSLWYKKYTSEFFKDNIKSGNAEFWTIEINQILIGELYIFKSLNNSQFANGIDTAYLCAFRISEGFRGNGHGTALMKQVFERLKVLGFKYVTIGVVEEEKANIRLYNRLGFTERIEIFNFDPCDVSEDNKPAACTEFTLLRKVL